MKAFLSGLMLAAGMVAAPAALPAKTQLPRVVEGKTVPLTIERGGRRLTYRVEVARSPAQQEQGLMYRRHMGADHGMIFPMNPPRVATFWMRNTYIPLDLIFIRADGVISSIAPMAKPLSEDIVPAIEPVAAVLELNGGAAAKAGIRAGDRVRW